MKTHWSTFSATPSTKKIAAVRNAMSCLFMAMVNETEARGIDRRGTGQRS